jgi:hypothetical protein
VILVQLVHAVTGVKAAKQYQFDLSTLHQLHTSISGSEPSALLNMLQPSSWGAHKQQQQKQQQAQQQQQKQRIVELKCDGKPLLTLDLQAIM